jgi:hypothetical protein
MPSKLSTTVNKIATIPNHTNSILITEFHKYMKTNGASERHQNNSLKMVIAFAFFIEKDVTFYDIKDKEQISSFLDTKIRSQEEDPDKRWITTWNYLPSTSTMRLFPMSKSGVYLSHPVYQIIWLSLKAIF